MCGIAGLYRTDQPCEARLDSLKGMLAHLRHRGPDEMGYYFDTAVAMGTARLSIVDLAHGQQPIGDPTGRYWIVFNGEIYNYLELRAELTERGVRFESNSDTEVLLGAWIAWGPKALARLNGAFAFAIFDKQEGSLVLARDRFGKRPLYYTEVAHGVAFCSEMKGFLAHESFAFEFDGDELASIFRVWTPLEDQSGFKRVRQVPAGAYARVVRDSIRLVHYAPLDLAHTPRPMREEEAQALVYESLKSSVRLRLSGDVEVGAYLSGGIDSAIVTRLVAETKPGAVKTFSIGFEDAEFDETVDQHLVASHLGTRHSSIRISNADIVGAFPDALWHAETPVFRTAFVPMFLLSQLVRRSGLKVVLTGEGADEAFLGYDIFKETLLRERWPSLDAASKSSAVASLYPYLRRFGEYDQRSLVALFDRLSQDVRSPFFSHELRFHNSSLALRLLATKTDPLRQLEGRIRDSQTYESLSPVRRAQWLEYKTLLVGYLLSTQGDRMSLANSVENRCPFLDPRVVAAAGATNLQFDGGFDEKYLLKKAFADKLPARILKKPKQPYRAPDASAFLRHTPDYLELIRSEDEIKRIDVLDAGFCVAFVKRLLSKPPQSVSHAENQAFLLLLSVVLLHKKFVERDFARPRPIDDLLVRRLDGRP